MKVLHIGSKSPHVIGFINDFNVGGVEHFFMGNERVDIENCHDTFNVNLQHLNPIQLLLAYRSAHKIIKGLRPDVIHIHQVVRNSFWISRIAKKLNIPVVLTAWGSDVLIMPFVNKLYYYLVKTTIMNANIITGDAQVLLDTMKRIAPFKRYEWIQYGIHPVQSEEKKNIIYSNRLHKPLYNIDRIIDLFAEFHKENNDFHLKVAATGTETDALKQKVRDLKLENNISFLGWLSNDENRKHYSTALMYVSIPDSDGTSVSLLEAMSAKCIPVVSDLPANREWISDGKNGVIFRQGTNPFSQALNLKQEEVAFANALLIDPVTRKRSVEKFHQFYRELYK